MPKRRKPAKVDADTPLKKRMRLVHQGQKASDRRNKRKITLAGKPKEKP